MWEIKFNVGKIYIIKMLIAHLRVNGQSEIRLEFGV